MLTNDEFAKGFAVLCEVYNKTPSEALTTIYRNVLAPRFTAEQWQQAIATVIATRVYPTLPLPAELIQAIWSDVEMHNEIVGRRFLERAAAERKAKELPDGK